MDKHVSWQTSDNATERPTFKGEDIASLYSQLNIVSGNNPRGSASPDYLDMGDVQSLYGNNAQLGRPASLTGGTNDGGSITTARASDNGYVTAAGDGNNKGYLTAFGGSDNEAYVNAARGEHHRGTHHHHEHPGQIEPGDPNFGSIPGDGSTGNPGTGTHPGDGGSNPGGGSHPGDGGSNPGGGSHPGDGGSNAGGGSHPGDGGSNPGGGSHPGDGGSNPGSGSGDGNPDHLKIGMYVKPEGNQSGSDAFQNMEQKVGQKLGVDNFYVGFGKPLDMNRIKEDIKNGVEPMISMTAGNSKDIASGKYDAYLKQIADELKKAGGPVILRYGYEMDNSHVEKNAGNPKDFVDAWRHISDVIHTEGASNINMCWCPTAAGYKSGKADSYFPGSQYVDSLGCDGYNRSATNPRAPQDIFAPFVKFAADHAPNKPLVIGETGTVGTPEQKAQWLQQLEKWAQGVPNMSALVYWDSYNNTKGWDYSINNPIDEQAINKMLNA